MTTDDRPVLVFDVNETLSDMRPLRHAFEEVGVPGELAATWFASVLREGFALAVHGEAQPFSVLGQETARTLFTLHPPAGDVEDAVARVLDAVQRLPLHADVPDGVRSLADAGFRLTALTNGSAATAEGLLERAGVRQHFEQVCSVEDAPLLEAGLRGLHLGERGVGRAAGADAHGRGAPVGPARRRPGGVAHGLDRPARLALAGVRAHPGPQGVRGAGARRAAGRRRRRADRLTAQLTA
ncbi:HAD family hydrolase [Kocuria rosea]|uniref:HAD family hydrolase n=1 Tax=Kocuria rosea TaxID=1275 RepID=UPI0025410AC8|nr:HAD family hydrolase [Kocuria rosea]WIG18115.1 hypothetical protein QOY29_04075 [Kocuria rosea]